MCDEVVYGLGMGEVEEVTGSRDDAIGADAMKGDQAIPIAMHVVNRPR